MGHGGADAGDRSQLLLTFPGAGGEAAAVLRTVPLEWYVAGPLAREVADIVRDALPSQGLLPDPAAPEEEERGKRRSEAPIRVPLSEAEIRTWRGYYTLGAQRLNPLVSSQPCGCFFLEGAG